MEERRRLEKRVTISLLQAGGRMRRDWTKLS
jgi:hypothetical protein